LDAEVALDRMKKTSHLHERLTFQSHSRDAMRALLMLCLLLVATEKRAMAYADPGSGSLILQALFAGFVGVLFNIRRLTTWVRDKVSKN
jgi:hypothetical protein